MASVLLIGADMPDDVPIPVPRPDLTPEKIERPNEAHKPKVKDEAKEPVPDQSKPSDATEVYVPPPIEKEDPALHKACLDQLAVLGVEYKQIPAIADGNGCGIDQPIEVTSLGSGIALSPPGNMRCETALQLARWTQEIVAPMLKAAKPGETLAGLDQASTYVCRKRNNAETGKISEHAHGNAADIAGFRFKSGARFDIRPRMQDSTLDGAFQRAITAAACLYFTTVLDPGSDKAHETHLHLDILKRKGGYRYCW